MNDEMVERLAMARKQMLAHLRAGDADTAALEMEGAPEPRVIGHGLQHIPAALETQRSGVSATKIVVSLDAG
jgi:hypothetical protein